MSSIQNTLVPLLLLGSFAFGTQPEPSATPELSADESPGAKNPATENPVAKIADAYIAATLVDRNLERSGALLHDDVSFIDPTAEVWGPGPAAKGVRGREEFLALQKSWKIESSSFELITGFESGPYALRMGKISWKAEGAPAFENIAFAMMLKIEEGRIRSRVDFGDYDELIPGVPSNTEELKAIGLEFLEAYGSFDAGTMGELYTDTVRFTEVHPQGVTVQGRAQVLAYLKAVNAGITDLQLKLEPAVVSYQHVLYTGSARFEFDTNGPDAPGGARPVEVPFWVLLKVVDGEIVEQRDFTGLDHLAACLRSEG